MEEGYIKYTCDWLKQDIAISVKTIQELNLYRSLLIKWGMIGKIPEGPGFGNVSVRHNNYSFYITGTNTGHKPVLTQHEIALVTEVDSNKNYLSCIGLTQASSESMSHHAVYNTLPAIGAVIHIHHKKMWKYYLHKIPTTPVFVLYGTPEMAHEITSNVLSHPQNKVIILGGHQDGLLSFGTDLKEAFLAIEKLFALIK